METSWLQISYLVLPFFGAVIAVLFFSNLYVSSKLTKIEKVVLRKYSHAGTSWHLWSDHLGLFWEQETGKYTKWVKGGYRTEEEAREALDTSVFSQSLKRLGFEPVKVEHEIQL